MAEELRIRVIFETGDVQRNATKAAQGVKVLTGSITDLERRLKQATQVMRGQIEGTKAWENASKRVQNLQALLSQSVAKSNLQMAQSTRTSANMTMALQSMNFTIRDSPYFFRDFSLGILAVGNNLNPLIDSLIAVKREAKAAGSSFRRELWTALKGPGGVIFAFSVLVSVMQAVVFAMDGVKEKTEEAKDEMKEYIDEIKEFSKQTLNATLAQVESKLIPLAIQYTELNGDVTDGFKDQLNTLMMQRNVLKERISQLGDIEEIQNRINEKERELEQIRNTVIGDGMISPRQQTRAEQIKEEIDALRQRLKTAKESVSNQKIELTFLQEIRKLYGANTEQLSQINQWLDKEELTQYEINKLIEQKIKLYEDLAPKVAEAYQFFMEAGGQAELFGKEPTPMRDIFNEDGSMKSVEVPFRKKEGFEEEKDNLKELVDIGSSLGTALSQAFIQGNIGAQQFLQTLMQIVVQMLIIDGIKSVFSAIGGGGGIGLFSLLGFQKGGIIGANSGAILDGTSYSGDRQLFLGNAGEMVLNRQQQKNLLAMLTYGRMRNQKLKVEVAVTGHLRANKNEFISDFKKAEKNFNKGLIKVVDSY